MQLRQHYARELKGSSVIVSVDESLATIDDARRLMRQYNLTSLPLTLSSSSSLSYTNIVHATDLVTLIVFQPTLDSGTVLDMSVKHLVGVSTESRTISICDDDCDLHYVFKELASGQHCMLINDTSFDQTRIITQTDALQFILDQSPSFINQSLTQAKLAPSTPLSTLSHTSNALDGFRMMIASGELRVLPIVDDDHHIIDCLNANDITYYTHQTLSSLNQPVLSYLSSASSSPPPPDRRCMLVTVKPHSMLRDVITAMISKNTHYAWIVNDDDDDRLIGVLAMTDIMHRLLL